MTPFYWPLVGDCRETLKSIPDGSVHCCVTSPPYFGLRDYGMADQIGLEQTPQAFVADLVAVLREVRRVLRDDGTLWLNLGDSYGKGKQLLGIPWRTAFALQEDGWYLRQDIIWHKPNPMPESVRDRCTKAHEYIFLLSKSQSYYFDSESIKEPSTGRAAGNKSHKCTERSEKLVSVGDHRERTKLGLSAIKVSPMRNKRDVWQVASSPYREAHFATFPPQLIEPCVLAGCPVGGTVLDPFGGSGTTAGVANAHGRNAILCDLNPEYAALMPERVASIIDRYARSAHNAP